MKEFWKGVVQVVRDIVKVGERQVTYSFYNIKKKVFRFALELLVFAIAIVFILVGAVMVLDRFFPIEYVLLIAGLLLINFVLLTARFK